MMGVKYDLQKFNIDDGLSTWQRRMKGVFIQQGLHKALEDNTKKSEPMKPGDWGRHG